MWPFRPALLATGRIGARSRRLTSRSSARFNPRAGRRPARKRRSGLDLDAGEAAAVRRALRHCETSLCNGLLKGASMPPHCLCCLKEVCRGHHENFRRRVVVLVGDAGTGVGHTGLVQTLEVESVKRLSALDGFTGLGAAGMARNAPARGVVTVFQYLVRQAGV